MAPTDAGPWEQAIASCEARLDAASAALDHGDLSVVAPFVTPPVTGTIPDALLGRVRECASRGEALQLRLADELERIRLELRRLPRMPPARPENRFDAQA
jgi:hypothetical protein